MVNLVIGAVIVAMAEALVVAALAAPSQSMPLLLAHIGFIGVATVLIGVSLRFRARGELVESREASSRSRDFFSEHSPHSITINPLMIPSARTSSNPALIVDHARFIDESAPSHGTPFDGVESPFATLLGSDLASALPFNVCGQPKSAAFTANSSDAGSVPEHRFNASQSLFSAFAEGHRKTAITSVQDDDEVEWILGTAPVGSGTSANVYPAVRADARDGQLFAARIESVEPDEVPMLRREVNTLRGVQCEQIVKFVAFATDHGDSISPTGLVDCVTIMEYVSCGTVGSLLKSFPAFPRPLRLLLLKDVLLAIRYIHKSKGIAHLDIKPDNILVTAKFRAKLVDFGVSAFSRKSIGSRASAASSSVLENSFESHTTRVRAVAALPAGRHGAGVVRGTPLYMAPEQARGKPVMLSDIWAFGILFLQLLQKEQPYPQTVLSSPTFVFIIGDEGTPIKPTISPSLSTSEAEVAAMCFERDPDKRATARDILNHSLFKAIADE